MTQPLHAGVLSRDQIIAAIYETVLRPELCDRFCPGLPGRAPETGSGGGLRPAADLRSHFSRAQAILEEQWAGAGRPEPVHFTPEGRRFWLLAGAGGALLHASSRARLDLAAGTGPLPQMLALTGPARQWWNAALADLRGGGRPPPEIAVLATEDPRRRLLCRPVWAGSGLDPAAALMAEALDFEWQEGTAAMLTAAFGFTAAETSGLEALMAGQPGPPPGRLREICAKAGAPGAAALLRLLAFLIAEQAADRAIASGDAMPPLIDFQTPAGRAQYWRLGAETGQPVIFVHGMLDGIAPVQRLQPELRRQGLRVYAPLRFGYGQSDPLPPGADPVGAFVQQTEALIDAERLCAPVLLAHRCGAAYAQAAAQRLRGPVAGMVAVAATAPMRRFGDLSGLRGHQRALLLSSIWARPLLPAVMRSWSRSVRTRGPQVLVTRQARRGGLDSGMIGQLGLDKLLDASHGLAMRQGGAGIAADLQVLQGRWRSGYGGHSAPAIYLHGGADPVTPAARLQQSLAGLGNVQIRLCKEAGALMFYVMPELVLAALAEFPAR